MQSRPEQPADSQRRATAPEEVSPPSTAPAPSGPGPIAPADFPVGEFAIDASGNIDLAQSDLSNQHAGPLERIHGEPYLDVCAAHLGRTAVATRELAAGLDAVRSGVQRRWTGECGLQSGLRNRYEVTLFPGDAPNTVRARHTAIYGPPPGAEPRDASDTAGFGLAEWDGDMPARQAPSPSGRDAQNETLSALSGGVGKAIFDHDCKLVWLDAQGAALSGRQPGCDRTESIGSFIAGPTTDRDALEELAHAASEGRRTTVELIRYTASGEPCWSSFSGYPIDEATARALVASGGTPARLAGEGPWYVVEETDISDRKHAQHMRWLAQHSLDEASPPGFWVNASGRVLYANEPASVLLARPRELLADADFGDLAPELSAPSWAGFWEHLAATGTHDAEMLFYDSTGNAVHTMASWSYVALEGQGYACVFVRDTSTERESERRLVESERRLRLLFESSHDAIVLVHTTGRVVDVNTAACELLGAPRDELLSAPVARLERRLWPDGENTPGTLLRAATMHGSSSGEVELDTDGTTRLVEYSSSNVGDDLLLVIMRDVSGRGATDAALRTIAHGTSSATGAEFLRRLARYLAQALHADHTLFAVMSEKTPGEVRVVTTTASGEAGPPTNAPTDTGTLRELLQRPVGSPPLRRATDRRDDKLMPTGARTVIGLPLFDNADHPIGALMVVSRQERYNPSGVDAILRIFATRAAAELERQIAYRRLTDSEQRYRRLLDQLPDASIVHRRGTILFANANAARLLHASSPTKLVGLDLYDFVHPNDRTRLAARDKEAAISAGKPPALLEASFRTLTGGVAQVESTANIVEFQGRSAVHLVLRDVSDRRKAERTLDRFFKLSPDVLCIMSQRGQLVRVNDAFCRLVGLGEAELIQLSLFDLVHPDDASRMASIRLKLSELQGRTDFTVRVRSGDDGYRSLEWSLQPEAYESLIYAVGRDVTERLESQRTVSKQSQIIDQLHDSVISTDMNGVIVSWNPGAERMFGYTASEAIGRHVALVEPRLESGLVRSSFLLPLDDKRSREVEHELVRQDGSRFFAQTSLSVQRDEQQMPVGIIGVSTDITRRKQLEAELRQSQKLEAVGMLSSGIAHDFNNILTAIFTDVRTIERELAGDDRSDNALQAAKQIGKAALQARSVTSALLTFSRGSKPTKTATDLAETIEESARLINRMLPGNVELRTDTGEDAAWVLADRTQLQQILVNLCVNARDAMPCGGRVTIALGKGEALDTGASYVHLTVTDTGVGIPPEHIDRVFEPFFTTKPRGQGTGLGLSIIHGVVEEHSGKLEISSEPGQGTSITILLPAIEPPIMAEAKPAAAPRLGAGRCALLHCKSDFLMGFVATMLETEGFDVACTDLAADNCADAAADGPPPALCLVDATDAESVAATARALAERDMPLVFMVDAVSDQNGAGGVGESSPPFTARDLARALEANGIADRPGVCWLEKPFHAADLADLLERCLASAPAGDGGISERQDDQAIADTTHVDPTEQSSSHTDHKPT